MSANRGRFTRNLCLRFGALRNLAEDVSDLGDSFEIVSEPTDLVAVRSALQDAGIVVIAEADNGRDAIDLAVHFRPDVVLMDVVMVGLDGIGATRVIAERAPEVRIVLITSSEDEELGVLGLRAGADGHVTKDAEPDHMVDVVRRVVNEQKLAAYARAVTIKAEFEPVIVSGDSEKLRVIE